MDVKIEHKLTDERTEVDRDIIEQLRKIGSGGGAGPGTSSGVSSFNSRTGDVMPRSGDYDISKIEGLQDALNVINSQIGSKANKTEVEAVKTSVESLQDDVNDLERQMVGKANKTEVEAVKTSINELSSQLPLKVNVADKATSSDISASELTDEKWMTPARTKEMIDQIKPGSGGSVSGDYLPLTGGTLSGDLIVEGNTELRGMVSEGSSVASGKFSHAEGANTIAKGNYSHAEGAAANVDGETVHAEASGDGSHAEGGATTAKGNYSHAEGYATVAEKFSSHAEGANTTAKGDYSHAEGGGTTAQGSYSHAEGANTTAQGYCSHAEGRDTNPQGYYSHAEGSGTNTQGDCSHAEGNGTTAQGDYSHAEGNGTNAQGDSSHAEGSGTNAQGYYSHAEGSGTNAQGNSSHAEGEGTSAQGYYSHAGGRSTLAHAFECAIGRYNKDSEAGNGISVSTATTFLVVGNGTADTSRANLFRITSEGIYGATTFTGSGADYAEMFEWEDGNPNKEDRVGRFVAISGTKIYIASSLNDILIGVVSATPTVLGDSASEEWHGRYLTDIFGRSQMEDVEVVEEDENGKKIVDTERRKKINPDYEGDQKYISRTERPEWAAVGMLGKLVMIDDRSCRPGGFCKPREEGIATFSEERTKYYVMERLDDSHIRILIL